MEADRDAILSGFQAWLKAAEAGDADAYASFMTEDAVILSPGLPEVVGRPSILAATKAFVARNSLAFADWMPQQVLVSGDVAVHRYTIATTRHPKGEGDPVRQEQRYIDVLRRDVDGRWLVSHHMFNVA
jgi:uncharacterized protein (TIGR02246 family)